MVWIEPNTSWLETDRCKYTDINRIAGNINYLLGADTLKADYTQNDVITLAEWNLILMALDLLAEAAGYSPEDKPDTTATARNFNAVEGYTLGLKNWIDLINAQEVASIFSGDTIYLGDLQYLR